MSKLFKEWCIETNNLNLLKELDLDLNAGIDLETLTIGSNKMINWRCEKGHIWQTQVCNRVRGDHISLCPYCSNIKVLPGYNDMATLNPTMAEMFEEEANGISPSNVLANSNKRYIFRCSKGHSFTAIPVKFRKHCECPICKKEKADIETKPIVVKQTKVVLKKQRKLKSLLKYRRTLAKEYDKDKNDTPIEEVFINKDVQRVYWWICPNGHSFKCSLHHRLIGSSCPYCSKKNRKPLLGVTDFATEHPELLLEWDYEKNNAIGLYPNEVTSGSAKVAFWKCSKCGYEWKTQIRTRSKGMMACKNCKNN